MINIAIIDDDPIFLDYSSRIIKEHIDYEYTLDIFIDTNSFLSAYRDTQYQLIFLDYDIVHNKTTGYDLLDLLPKTSYKPIIIMVTSFANVNVITRAFHYNIFRYIIKQNFDDEIKETLTTAFHKLSSQTAFITVKDQHHTYKLPLSNLYCVYSESYYVIFETQDESIRIRMSIKKIKASLMDNHFVHAKSNTLINIYHISKFDHSRVYLDNNTSCLLSRSGYKELSKAFFRYRV